MWSVVMESPSLARHLAPADTLYLGLLEDVVEERGVPDVGGCVVPVEQGGLGAVDGIPAGGSLEDVVVLRDEGLPGYELAGDFLDLLVGGPDVPEVDVFAIHGGQGLLVQVDVHTSRDGERHDEGRGCEVVGLHEGVDTSLEVPIG